MKAWLKKHFIAHHANDYQPHILRRRAISFLLLAVFLIETAYLFHTSIILPQSASLASIVSGVLTDGTNATRSSNRLSLLKPNPLLEQAAQKKADDMAEKSYFAHTSSDGVTPWHWFQEVDYPYLYAGENLAIHFTDSEDVIDAWMNSPTHRANILNTRFTEMGIATAQGSYQGRATIFVVQLFGTPLETSPLSLITPVAEASNKFPIGDAPTSEPSVVSPTNSPIAAVKGEAIETSGSTTTALETKTEIKFIEKSSTELQKLITQPKTFTNNIYLVIGFIISISLLLNFMIRSEARHPHLFVNCLVLVTILTTATLLNNYLAISQLQIS